MMESAMSAAETDTGMPAQLIRSPAEKKGIMEAGVAAQQQGMEGSEPPPPQGQTAL